MIIMIILIKFEEKTSLQKNNVKTGDPKKHDGFFFVFPFGTDCWHYLRRPMGNLTD